MHMGSVQRANQAAVQFCFPSMAALLLGRGPGPLRVRGPARVPVCLRFKFEAQSNRLIYRLNLRRTT